MEWIDAHLVMRAAIFAADKHRYQKRRDKQTPYINHPLAVASILVHVARVKDAEVLAAALLHDTIEDTETTVEELRTVFGERVLSLVLECTDDKELPKEERKRLQVKHASSRSRDAKLIKIADKISNMSDLTDYPPVDWSRERSVNYIKWCGEVFDGLKGVNQELDELFDSTTKRAQKVFDGT
jgi:guanosine-3',5'-bis(diphosphate) 3'-pyrophosphohydrolase